MKARVFGFVVLFAETTFMLACGGVEPSDAVERDVFSLEEATSGDRGGARDPREVDPTRAPGYRSELARVIDETPERVVLDFRWFGQPNGYWCGPGASRIALSTHMAEPPTQPVLAEFLGTTTDGTARIDMIRALNHWLTPRESYTSIPMDMAPTQEQRDLLKQNLLKRLSGGWPVVANVLSGWRPPGYPSGTIGHFVVVVGYEQHGERVLIADPAAEGSAGPHWSNVPATYWISFRNLGTWTGGRGYSG